MLWRKNDIFNIINKDLFLGVKTMKYLLKNGTVVTNVSIGDSSGNMTAVWFNQSFMQRNIPHEPGGYILGFMEKKSYRLGKIFHPRMHRKSMSVGNSFFQVS